MLKKTFSLLVAFVLALSIGLPGGSNVAMAQVASGSGTAASKPVLTDDGISITYHYSGGKLTSYQVDDYLNNTGASGSVTINISLAYSDGTQALKKSKTFNVKKGKKYHVFCNAGFSKASEIVKQKSFITITSPSLKQSNRYEFDKTLLISIGDINVEEMTNNSDLSDFKVYSGNQPLKLEDQGKNKYGAYVDANVGSVAIAAVAEDADAVVAVNGQRVGTGAKKVVALKSGENEITIKVTAPDKTTYTIITVKIVRSSSASVKKWTKSFAYVAGLVAGKSNELYATAGDGRNSWLLSIAANGSEKKLYSVSGELRKPVVGQDGSIYIWSDSKLIALTASGKAKWTYDAKSTIRDVRVGTDNTVYLGIMAGYTDVKLCALNPAGKALWSFNTGSMYTDIYTGPEGMFYYTTRDDTKQDEGYMLNDLNAGRSKKWALNTGGSVNGMTFTENGQMLVSLSCKKLMTIDTKTGTKISEITVDAIPGRLAAGTDGTIYVTAAGVKELGKDEDGYMRISEYGLLIAFNQDGGKKWDLNLGAKIYGLSVAPNGMLYVTSDDHMIIRVDPSGVKKQEYMMAGYSTEDPVITPDGSVYSKDSENKIYSFGK